MPGSPAPETTKGNNKTIVFIFAGVFVALVAILLLLSFIFLVPRYSTPTGPYDIAGIVGMEPSKMEEWFDSESFTPFEGGGNALARVVVDGSEVVEGSAEPTYQDYAIETLSSQSYIVFSGMPSQLDLSTVFTFTIYEIAPAKYASSKPHAAMFTLADRAVNPNALWENAKGYLAKLLDEAGLTPIDMRESGSNNSHAYAIGTCKIAGKGGIWIADMVKSNRAFDGHIFCGYADEVMKAFDLTEVDSTTLGTLMKADKDSSSDSFLNSLSSEGSSSSSSRSGSSSSSQNYSSSSNNSARSSSSSSSSGSNSNDSSGTISREALVGAWLDPVGGSTFTLENNGSAILVQGNNRFSGRWRISSDGVVFEASGNSYLFTVSKVGNVLSLFNSDTLLLFNKALTTETR